MYDCLGGTMAQIKKEKNGWSIRISWRDRTGKLHQKYKSGFAKKADAKKEVLQLENDLIKGAKLDKNPTFAEYFKKWYEIYRKPYISKITQKHYDIQLKLVNEFFKDTPLRNIKRIEYQKALNIIGKRYSPSTTSKISGAFRACIKSAILDGLISNDITFNAVVNGNKNKVRKVEYLNLEEIKKLLHLAIESRNPKFVSNYIIVVGILTGARIGEILALTWEDIDFTDKTISINKTWDYHFKSGTKPPKTPSSVRTITINQKLCDLLKELQQNDSKYVFKTKTRNIPSTNGVNKCLNRLLAELKIHKKGFHFHSLRHAHVAILLFKGIDIYNISKRLGHTDISITTNTYAYLLDEFKKKTDKKINSIMDNMM
jgi:integrase